MGKTTISIAIFNSYVNLPEGNSKSRWLAMVDAHYGPMAVFFSFGWRNDGEKWGKHL